MEAYLAWGVAIVGLLVYEFYALATGRMLLTTAVRQSNKVTSGLVALLVGILCGHFFWCGCN